MRYFPFIETGDFQGIYSSVINTTSGISGSMCQPGDIIKLNEGTNAWSQIPESILLLNDEIHISSLSGTDWNNTLKTEWFDAYIKHIGLGNKLSPSQYNTLFSYSESIGIFEQISAPSIAYITRNDGSTSGSPYDDNFITNEVSIGMNVYQNEYIKDYAGTLPQGDDLRNTIYSNHISNTVYISNACKVTYDGYTDIVYCFSGIEYPLYNLNSLGFTPDLSTGGGRIFGEVKLAGDSIQAHYKIRKNISDIDPTEGMCSGEGLPLCMGDEIVIVDTTCWTENGTNGWSWIGDFTVLDYTWHLADVTNPCVDYRNVPVYDMLFPLRIIQFCLFEDFG
jgi:hypothetical protein